MAGAPRRPAAQRERGARPAPGRAPAAARRAHRAAVRPRRVRGDARAARTPPTARTARRPPSTRGSLAEQGRFDALEQAQRQALAQATGASDRARLALVFGTRWVLRHQNVDVGARFLEEAAQARPEQRGRVLLPARGLRQEGRRLGSRPHPRRGSGDPGRRRRARPSCSRRPGTIAWRQLGNLIRARLSFERLSAVSPEHPQLRAFEAQIGETLKPVAAARVPWTARAPLPSPPPPPPAAAAPTRRAGAASPRPARRAPRSATRPRPRPSRRRARAAAPVRPLPPPAPAPAAAAPPPVDEAKIAELRQLADKQEGAKRYNEYVKTLLQLAALVADLDEKSRSTRRPPISTSPSSRTRPRP